MMYLKCMQMVIGKKIIFFTIQIFINSLVYCTPFGIIFGLISTEIYILMHSSKLFYLQIVYIILALASWLVFLPFVFNSNSISNNYQKQKFSSGYFRKIRNNLYYFNSVSPEHISGLQIPLSFNDVSTFNAKIFKKNQTLPSFYDSFSDTLVKKGVEPPFFLSFFFKGYELFFNKGCEIIRSGNYFQVGGKIPWLSFASMGLPLILIFLFAYSSLWKMIDAFFIIMIPIGTIMLNVMYYKKLVFDFTTKVHFIYPLTAVPDITIVLCNIFISLLVVLSCIILHVVRTERSE